MKRLIDLLVLASTGTLLIILASVLFPQNRLGVEVLPTPNVQGISSINVASSYVNEFAKVSRVIDGDTIVLSDGRHVRLIGIDTPEVTNGNSDCFGIEAKNYLSKLLTEQQVGLEKDVSETDKYGRLLRYVYLDDEFVNNLMVQGGFAKVATYPPDVKYQQRFLESERYARGNNLGLWGKCLE